MPGPVCWHFYNGPLQYFTHPDISPFPRIKACYEQIPWKERIQKVSAKGRYFSPINSERVPLYREYVRELADSDPIYYEYPSALEDCLMGGNAQLPVGGLVDVNHWGMLQVCILQCAPFADLQYGPGQYPKSARFEAIAEILYMAGLEDGYISAVADRLRKKIARLPL